MYYSCRGLGGSACVRIRHRCFKTIPGHWKLFGRIYVPNALRCPQHAINLSNRVPLPFLDFLRI